MRRRTHRRLCACARGRAAASRRDRSRFGEAGDTLVEILLALIVLGLASVALLIAFSTSISASATHRQLATSDIVLSAVSQQAISEVNAQLNLFTTCQTLAYFQSKVPLTVPSAYSATYSAQLTNVQYWNATTAAFGAACTTDQPEEITVSVTHSGHTFSNSFVVDYPLAGATTQSGAGSAAQLVWTTPPSTTASTSIPFAQQPVLQVEDANGNVVTTDLSPVIISIQSGTSGALSGCSGDESNGGVVVFSGCELTQAGTYTLMATDGNLTTTLVSDPTVTVSGSTTPYLVFTTQPVAGASGSTFSTEPVIKVYLGGSVDTSWPTGSINLSVSGGIFGPSSCTTPTVTSGVATLPNTCLFQGGIFYDPVSNQTLGVPYTMTASGNGLIPATSNSFKVSAAGPATQLVFATQPSGVSAASASTAFSTQPVVDIEDAYGNVVTSSRATVTLAVNSNSFGATLSGCSSTTTKGVATFSGCQLNKFGTGYTLQASSSGLPSIGSSSFNVTGVASYMLFTTQPAAGISGSTLPTQPVITIYDANNFVVTASTTALTLTASGGSLTLCTNLTPYQGVVTVATCNFAGIVGTNYTLTATQGAISVVSSPISPTAAGAPTKLVFTTQPTSVTAGSAFATQPVVKIEDSAGNVVLTSSATITLSAAPADGTLTSCGNLQAVAGVVNVTGCTFGGTIGEPYTLTASSANVSSATSANFSPTAPGPIDSITLSGCASNIQWNASCTATATVFDAWNNQATTYSSGITFAQVSGTGAVTGLSTISPVNGVASDTVTGSVVGTLQITATGSSIASNPITITVVGIPQTVAFYTTNGYTTTTTSGTTTYAPSGTYQTYAQGSGLGTITFASSTPSVCTVNSSTGLVGIVGAGTCNLTADAGATAHYADSGTTPFTLTINKATQAGLTLTSTTGTFPTSVTLTTTGGSGTGAVTYAVNAGGTATGCSVAGSTLSFTSAGTCFVTATKAADSNYNAISSAQTTVTIAKGTQGALTITSTTGTFPNSVTLTTSGGSGTGAVTYVVNAGGTATGCSVAGATLSFTSTGTCFVTATKAADSGYNAISSAQTTVTIAQGTQAALTITSTTGTYPTSVTLTTSGGSGTGAVTYVVNAGGTATGCSVAGATLSFTSAGTCFVTATKAADSNYNAISSAQTTVTINQATQAALTVTSTTGTFPTSVTLTTSGGSGTGAVTYVVNAGGTATGCSVAGTTLSFTSAGTCFVTATKAADTNYLAQSSAQTTVTIAKGTQAALTITSTTGTFPNSVTLTTSGGSGTGAVTYVVNAGGTATGCSVAGATLSFTSVGTCFVTATKAADSGYNAISSAQTTVTIAVGTQAALTITSTTGTYPTSVTLTTSGGSGTGAVTYVVNAGGTATGCSVAGATLSYTSAGTCFVTATKAADSNYNAISSAQTTVTIAKANQAALTVTSTTGTYPTSVTLTTSGGSGTGAVTYVVNAGGTATGCSVAGTTLSYTSAGTCFVTATKATDTNYNAISSAQTTVTIAKATQAVLTITSTSGTYLTALTLAYSGGSSGGAVTYVVNAGGTATGCTINGAGPYTLTTTSTGTCFVTATMAGGTNYNNVSSAQTTITIGKATQAALTVTSTSGTILSALTLVSSGGSGTGAVTFGVSNGTATGCTVNGAGPYTLTATTSGTCSVTATKAADSNYNAISSSATTVTLFGTHYWSNTNTGSTTVTSPSFTAPTGEPVLILVTFEMSNPLKACATPAGTAALTNFATVLTPAAWYTNSPTNYVMCAYSAKGSNTTGTVTETFTGSVTSSTIQVIEVTGDNAATFGLAKTNTGSSAAPAWLLTGAPTSNYEFLFGALTNGATPPTWSAIAGYTSLGTLSVGSGALIYSPTVYVGTPSATTVNGSTSATANWGTIGIQVSP